MEFMNEIFPIILYILGSILLIVLIVLVVHLIKTLGRVDTLIDDVSVKSGKLNGVFDLVDMTADAIAGISDMAVGFVTRNVNRFLNKKRKEEEDHE